MRKNPVKEKLKQGEAVLGAFANFASPTMVEILGLCGLDFVIVDSEHAPIMADEAENTYRAAEAGNITPITRIRSFRSS